MEIGRIFEEDTLAVWNGALNLYHGNTLYMLHGVYEVKKINILVPSTSSVNTQANISAKVSQLFTTNLENFEVCLIITRHTSKCSSMYSNVPARIYICLTNDFPLPEMVDLFSNGVRLEPWDCFYGKSSILDSKLGGLVKQNLLLSLQKDNTRWRQFPNCWLS